MKTHSIIPIKRFHNSWRSQINPIRALSPQSLTRILDAFNAGRLGEAALAWDAIERRDDVIQGVASKRKKSVARLPWEILTLDDSTEALQHKEALQFFYNNLTATHACDNNQSGGLSLLVKQMLDAIGKKYAVHEIVYKPLSGKQKHKLTASFRFVPLWFFENTAGNLRFLPSETATEGQPLNAGSWLITTGDGLMEASSIAYLFKHLPLRDWLIYCERNGMPGVKGVTEAQPGTPQWDIARHAVQDFGAEFNALMTRGTDIQPIDLSTRGELPYPALVERMDRALIALWRGSDLSTLAKNQATGVSLQSNETNLLQQDDALLVSETLNAQVDRFVFKHLFNVERGKAYIRIQSNDMAHQDLELYRKLHELGVPLPLSHIQERFGIPHPQPNESTLTS